MEKKLMRSKTDKKIAGVCGGIAKHFGFDSNILRIIWVVSILFGGVGIFIYIACAFILPEGEE